MLLNVLFNWSMVVWLVVIWASSGFKAVTCVKSSGCKLDALFKLHFDPSKAHFPVCLPCYDLPPLAFYLVSIGCVWLVPLEEGDGRCVHASLPYSTKLSILDLLLNPPLVFSFIKTFVSCS